MTHSHNNTYCIITEGKLKFDIIQHNELMKHIELLANEHKYQLLKGGAQRWREREP
jgi:hypothetical protein